LGNENQNQEKIEFFSKLLAQEYRSYPFSQGPGRSLASQCSILRWVKDSQGSREIIDRIPPLPYIEKEIKIPIA
jgi:hypothetical protein